MKLSCLLLASLLTVPGAAGAAAPALNRESVWFKPSLAVNAAPFCEDLLRIEQETFFSVSETRDYAQIGLTKIRGMYDDATKDPQVHPFGYHQWGLTLRDGQLVFAYFKLHPGCGGGCDAEQVLVGDESFEPSSEPGQDSSRSPLAAGWDLYKSTQGDLHVLGTVEHRLQAYRVAAPAKLELSCEVTIRPARLSDHDDPAVRDAWLAVEALLQTHGPMAQGGGSCGSLNSARRNREFLRKALEAAVYRPWSARGLEAYHAVEIGGKLYGRNYQSQLEEWSLTGLAEFRAFNRYAQQRERSAAELGKFYRQKFGWPEPEATAEAARVLLAAFDRGFGFSSEFAVPPAEAALRRAILERQPMSAIENREVPLPPAGPPNPYAIYDSLLNAAVEYPEALRYLLHEGLDPNVANAFGKTPLMYAAQYNQLESVRILLAAGADPNAATFIPEDECFYTLKTGGMTPLHYAARYASASLIRLLVAEGAATFMRTRGKHGELDEAPLDWLKTYTGHAASETNPNVAASELAALMKLLDVPNYAERGRISVDLTTRAQAEYARAEYRKAYSHLKTALAAKPDNPKALADLPLMAAKVGRVDEAIEAAKQATEAAPSVTLRASAWFNLGMLCEDGDDLTSVFRAGRCDTDWMQPFVQAWKLQPTKARANKLRQLFDKRGVVACNSGGLSLHQKMWSLASGRGVQTVQRVYVLHELSDALSMPPDTFRVKDRMTLDDLAITVLQGPKGAALPEINGNPCGLP